MLNHLFIPYLHHISHKWLRTLLDYYKTKGLTPRVHGNTRRLPPNTTPYNTIKEVVRFILNLPQKQALILPGRIPGYHRCDVWLLPSSTTKLGIWSKYYHVWMVVILYLTRPSAQLVPQVVIMKPMTNLYWKYSRTTHFS